jgi:hypothetical protein
MVLADLLQRILRRLSPDDLWALQPALLALDSPEAETAREIAHCFYCYASRVESKLDSKHYSTVSARLAGGSIGVLAAQDVLEALASPQHGALGELLSGGLAGMLEVLSSLQSVKAWETEFESVHEEAVWDLYAALWRLSVDTQPGLPADQRQAMLDPLFAVIRSREVDGTLRMALIIWLYQVALAIRLAPLLSAEPGGPSAQGATAS